jgi:hypothetical protein
MALFMLIENAKPLASGVWSGSTPPHALQMLGQPKLTKGEISVLGVEGPLFDERNSSVRFDASKATVLSLGSSDRLVVIEQNAAEADLGKPLGNVEAASSGPGDRQFLQIAKSALTGNSLKAAQKLLEGVRSTNPGDLKKGKRLNFSNTPDNFWYVIVQPRAQSVSITVRGLPEHFQPSTLELKVDRPGYTRFSLRKTDDVGEALRIIGLSKRRVRY